VSVRQISLPSGWLAGRRWLRARRFFLRLLSRFALVDRSITRTIIARSRLLPVAGAPFIALSLG
jgi:hypothetical protein